MSPEKVQVLYGVEIRISGCSTGTQSPPPVGKTLFLAASMANISFIWATFSGILPARSLAWDQSSSRL